MGTVSVTICDMCGKRTDKLPYQLALFREYKKPYYSKRTVWSKKVCDKCGRKIGATKTIADEIQEDIELKMDKLRIQKQEIKLLK